MDVVIPVGPEPTDELRYCLRSIAAHLPHDNVWIVGAKPDWLARARYIETDQTDGTKWSNAKLNRRLVCEHPEVSDPFVLFDDDFFVMEPLDTLPTLHLGPLSRMHENYLTVFPVATYTEALGRTLELLRSYGIAEPLSYEAHVPMVVTKQGYLQALDIADRDPRLHERSIYGNLTSVGGTLIDDVKVYKRDDPIPTGPFLSTTDRSFVRWNVGKVIRRAFPDPCEYENRRSSAI